MLRFDLSKALQALKKRKLRLVAVQVPEGMKSQLAAIVEQVENETSARAFAFVGSCFGACDVLDSEAKLLGADLLLHFGHTKLLGKHAVETIYVPVGYEADEKAVKLLAEKLSKILTQKKLKRLALCSTIQFSRHRDLLKNALRQKGFAVFVGKGTAVEKGQVLGCNYSCVKDIESKVEAAVFVGDGLFHPLGLGFAVKKPVLVADPVQVEAMEFGTEKDLFLRKRIAAIEKGRLAKNVGVWVSTKRGQQRMRIALQLVQKFKSHGKKAFLVVSNEIRPEYVAGIPFDAMVVTACPRIALDDSSLFRQAILNPTEALIALGEKKLEDYSFEELA